MATKTAPKKSTTKKSTTAKSTSSRKKTTLKTDTSVVRRAKSVGWMAIIESLVIGALGICLIVTPNTMLKIVFYIVGIFLMIKGVYKILNYFAVHGKYDFYNNDLLYGVVALIFGVICVVLWEQLKDVVGIVVGVWMIYGALVRMNTAIKMHAVGIREWFYVLLLSMVMLALGIYMIISVNTGVSAMLALVGWLMVAGAVIGILDDIIFIRHLDAVTQ